MNVTINKSAIQLLFPGEWPEDLVLKCTDIVRDADSKLTHEIMLAAVRRQPSVIRMIPECKEDIWETAITKDPWLAIELPLKKRNIIVVRNHVIDDPSLLVMFDNINIFHIRHQLRHSSKMISYMSDNDQSTYTNYEFPVENINFIRPSNRTKRYCVSAVNTNYQNIRYVPDDVMEQSAFHTELVSRYPAHWLLITDETSKKKAVSICPILSRFVATEMSLIPDTNIKITAPEVVAYIAFDITKLKNTIIKNNLVLTWIGVFRPELRDELNSWAYEQKPDTYRYMYKPSEQLNMAYIELNGTNIKYVPFVNSTIYRAAVVKSVDAIKFCQPPTSEDAVWLIQRDPLLLRHVRNQTPELCELAVGINGLALQYVVTQSLNICSIAVHQNPAALQYAQFQTYEMCKRAIEKKPMMLAWVREQTIDLCQLAISINKKAIRHVWPSIFNEAVLMKLYDG
jgi:hypothetical protein